MKKASKVVTASPWRGCFGACRGVHSRPAGVPRTSSCPTLLGWTVMSQLKKNPKTRHIPVPDHQPWTKDKQHALARGAFFVRAQAHPPPTACRRRAFPKIKAYVQPPAQAAAGGRGQSGPSRSASRRCWSINDIEIVSADTGSAALKMLREKPADLRGLGPAPARYFPASNCWKSSMPIRR